MHCTQFWVHMGVENKITARFPTCLALISHEFDNHSLWWDQSCHAWFLKYDPTVCRRVRPRGPIPTRRTLLCVFVFRWLCCVHPQLPHGHRSSHWHWWQALLPPERERCLDKVTRNPLYVLREGSAPERRARSHCMCVGILPTCTIEDKTTYSRWLGHFHATVEGICCRRLPTEGQR